MILPEGKQPDIWKISHIQLGKEYIENWRVKYWKKKEMKGKKESDSHTWNAFAYIFDLFGLT